MNQLYAHVGRTQPSLRLFKDWREVPDYVKDVMWKYFKLTSHVQKSINAHWGKHWYYVDYVSDFFKE